MRSSDGEPRAYVPAFRSFWHYAAERHAMYLARIAGQVHPWTTNEVLSEYRFTNVFRAADRTSQYLIRHVCYEGSQGIDDLFVRIALFRLFNHVPTWEALNGHFGGIVAGNFSFDEAAHVLTERRFKGHSIYSAAYILPPPKLGGPTKHANHLRLLELMLREGLPSRIAAAGSLKSVYDEIVKQPGMGPFLAYQLAIDINYSTAVDFDEMEFVVPGPGAVRGVRKCFPTLAPRDAMAAVRWTTERQQDLACEYGVASPLLFGRPMQLVDVQNVFCELDKYARVVHPEIEGFGRSRMKRRYRPGRPLPKPWFPPKWRLVGA